MSRLARPNLFAQAGPLLGYPSVAMVLSTNKAVLIAVLLAGCTGIRGDHPSLSLECADGNRNCDGKLGVGGIVWANKGEVVSRNEDVLHARHDDLGGLIGVSPGTAEIDLVDGNDL